MWHKIITRTAIWFSLPISKLKKLYKLENLLKQPFPLALRYLRNDKQNVNNLITAAVKFSERHGHGVDANDEYQRHHRHRRLTREVDENQKRQKILSSRISTGKNSSNLIPRRTNTNPYRQC